jgi:hypothetical protein
MTQIIKPNITLINNLRTAFPKVPQLADYLTQLTNFLTEQAAQNVNGNDIQLLSQSVNINGILWDVSQSGIYLVSVQQQTMNPGSAGKLRTTVSWTDDTGAQSRVIATDIDLTIDDEEDGIAIIRVAAGNQITYSTEIIGGAGTPTYNLFLFATQLG